MAAVLITVVDGATDYCVEGDVQVVLVDMDKYDDDRSFPGDVEVDIARVRTLPEMPWKTELIRRLSARRDRIAAAINNEPPPGDSDPRNPSPEGGQSETH